MRKNYVAPVAELMCFAACESIAAKPWEWIPGDMQNRWYAADAEGIASVNSWLPIDTDELDS